jgi:hypothetical protein
MSDDDPTPDDLLDDPQLAAVIILDSALRSTSAAIIAAHPELMTGDGFDVAPPESPPAWVALDAVRLMACLADVLETYRYTLRAPPSKHVPPPGSDF